MSNAAYPLAQPLTWFQVMQKAVLSPSLATYQSIAQNPGASAGKGFLWVAICAFITAPISALLLSIFRTDIPIPGLEGIGSSGAPALRTIVISMICSAPIAAIAAVIGLAFSAGVLHLVARVLGGQGEYGKLVYTLAAFEVPLQVVTSILLAIPYVNCLGGLIGIYSFVLMVLALAAAEQFGVGKAIAVVAVLFILVIAIFACLTIGILTLLAPTIQQIFQQIQSGIQVTP